MNNQSEPVLFAASDAGGAQSNSAASSDLGGLPDVLTLQRKLEAQERYQAVCSRLTDEAVKDLNLTALFAQVSHEVVWALQIPCCRILEMADGQGWILRASHNWNHHQVDELLPPEFGVCASLAVSSEQVIVFSAQLLEVEPGSPEGDSPEWDSQPDYQGLRCGAAVRIAGVDHGFGVLEVGGYQDFVFETAELNFLQTIGNLVGILIERKALATEILEVDDRMRLVMEASRDGIWEWDLRTNEVDWNDRLYEMFGLHRQKSQLTLEDVEQLYHPDDLAFARSFTQVSLTEKKWYEFEFRMRHANGTYRLLYVRASVIPRRDEGLPRVVGLVSDVTELREARQQALESESRFKILADATPALLAVTDTDGHALYYNQACQAFTGESSPELVDKSWIRYVYPEDRQKLIDVYASAIPQHQSFTFEYRAVRHDGVVRYFRNNGIPRFAPDGQFLGYVILAIDATEERQFSLRIQRIMDANLMGILSTDMNGQVIEANQAFLDMTGYTQLDVADGLSMWEITPPEYIDFSHDMIRRLKETGVCKTFEKQYFRKNGSRMDTLVTVASLEEGEPDTSVVLILDISAQKQAQRDLENNLVRERLNRSILELASGAQDIEGVIDQAVTLVGKQLQADRAFVIYYASNSQDSVTSFDLSHQYRTSDDILLFLYTDFSQESRDFVRRFLSPRMQETQAPMTDVAGFFALLKQCVSEAYISGEKAEIILAEFKSILLDRYQIHSYVRLPIQYLGKFYGSLNVQHCSRANFWSDPDLLVLKDVANYLGLVFYQSELHQQEQTVLKALEKSYQLINIISDAQTQFIGSENNHTIFQNLLNRLLDYTNSEYGFIGEVLTDDEGHLYLQTRYLTDISWNEETRQLYMKAMGAGMEFHNLQSLFGQVMVTGNPVLSNDPAHDPRRAGLPAGHPALNAFMGLPIYRGAQMVGMVGLANRSGGYDDAMIDNLSPYLAACANLIVAIRGEDMRNRLTQKLRLSEQALKNYASRLEYSNKELEQFATVASHDLQAPLRKVILFSDYLASALHDQLDEESRDYLARIRRAIVKMQHLITDLLALSRVGRQGKPFVPVDLGAIVEEVVSDLEVSIQESAGQVVIGPMMTIDADGLQMRQMIQNLLGNALKFHRPGVPPVVEISAVLTENGRCEIRVRDNGIGFDEKYRDRVFILFERLHGEQEFGGGTGLGLAIVKKIVERHCGQVSAHSTPGEGTTFIVSLPVHQN